LNSIPGCLRDGGPDAWGRCVLESMYGETSLTELEQAALHGSSVGGARPKALIEDGQQRFIAKFSTSTDTYDVVRAEFVAMRLAKTCALYVTTFCFHVKTRQA